MDYTKRFNTPYRNNFSMVQQLINPKLDGKNNDEFYKMVSVSLLITKETISLIKANIDTQKYDVVHILSPDLTALVKVWIREINTGDVYEIDINEAISKGADGSKVLIDEDIALITPNGRYKGDGYPVKTGLRSKPIVNTYRIGDKEGIVKVFDYYTYDVYVRVDEKGKTYLGAVKNNSVKNEIEYSNVGDLSRIFYYNGKYIGVKNGDFGFLENGYWNTLQNDTNATLLFPMYHYLYKSKEPRYPQFINTTYNKVIAPKIKEFVSGWGGVGSGKMRVVSFERPSYIIPQVIKTFMKPVFLTKDRAYYADDIGNNNKSIPLVELDELEYFFSFLINKDIEKDGFPIYIKQLEKNKKACDYIYTPFSIISSPFMLYDTRIDITSQFK